MSIIRHVDIHLEVGVVEEGGQLLERQRLRLRQGKRGTEGLASSMQRARSGGSGRVSKRYGAAVLPAAAWRPFAP